jgi:hypothetical protein
VSRATAEAPADKLALRLLGEARGAFLTKCKTRLSEQYGVVQKEHVEVPDPLLEEMAKLRLGALQLEDRRAGDRRKD